jgi:hypothetical protein
LPNDLPLPRSTSGLPAQRLLQRNVWKTLHEELFVNQVYFYVADPSANMRKDDVRPMPENNALYSPRMMIIRITVLLFPEPYTPAQRAVGPILFQKSHLQPIEIP